MGETSKTLTQRTFWDMTESTFSEALGDGTTPSSLPIGIQLDLFGPPPAPASPSASPGGARERKTPATSGPSASGSSASANLQRLLESKLVAVVDTNGSMEYSLTWRVRVTPAGRRICRLAARGRRTSGSGCSGWPTCQARDGDGRGAQAERANGLRMNLDDYAALTGWQTPTVQDAGDRTYTYSRGDHEKPYLALAGQAMLAGWPTAMVPNGGRTVEGTRVEEGREGKPQSGHLEAVALLAGWPSPSVNNYEPTDLEAMEARRQRILEQGINGNGFGLTLGMGVQLWLAGWASPASRDWRDGRASQKTMEGNARPLNEQAVMLAGWHTPLAQPEVPEKGTHCRHVLAGLNNQALGSGTPTTSSPAETASTDVLNPALPRWLQGFPETWDHCSPGWQSWATTQRLLALSFVRPEVTGSQD